MIDFESILRRRNLTYEELNPVEKQTYHQMVESMKQGQLTIEKIRDHITVMKQSVEQELTKHDLGSKQDLFLKARLRNYILLEGFLLSPEAARKRLESMLNNR